jgi:hypothetical protein
MKNKNNGVLKWGKKQIIDGNQSSYYDHTWYEVPFSGEFNAGAIRTALSKRYPNTGNYFGGYTTVGNVSQMNSEFVKVELVYHVGN